VAPRSAKISKTRVSLLTHETCILRLIASYTIAATKSAWMGTSKQEIQETTSDVCRALVIAKFGKEFCIQQLRPEATKGLPWLERVEASDAVRYRMLRSAVVIGRIYPGGDLGRETARHSAPNARSFHKDIRRLQVQLFRQGRRVCLNIIDISSPARCPGVLFVDGLVVSISMPE
jgi:hypothetical protein